jgi:3-oxoacyl-[acyl-carrier-protein] synthase-3
MAKTSFNGISLSGVVNVLPSLKQDNLHLNLIKEQERAHFIEVTGIRYRHIFAADTKIVNLFKQGITSLMGNLSWNIADVDVLICVTQTTHTNVPAISCQLHGFLGMPSHTIAFDVNMGCSGYVYGLSVVYSLLNGFRKSGAKAILCCGDLSSQLIEPTDQTTVPIFSDAVSVTGIECNNNDLQTSWFNLETFGAGRNAIYVEQKNDASYMRLNGIDVFNYSLKTVPSHVQELLGFANRSNADVYVFHQANKIINDAIAKKLAVANKDAPSTLHHFGNTASASIPVTLHHYLQSNKANGQLALLCGFGVGFSVASALVVIPDYLTTETIYLP